MKQKTILLLAAALLCLGMAAYAFAGMDTFSLNWWTVDGGGGQSAAAGYRLSGSIGQPDAHLNLDGGSYAVAGGFWVWQAGYEVYLPIVVAPP